MSPLKKHARCRANHLGSEVQQQPVSVISIPLSSHLVHCFLTYLRILEQFVPHQGLRPYIIGWPAFGRPWKMQHALTCTVVLAFVAAGHMPDAELDCPPLRQVMFQGLLKEHYQHGSSLLNSGWSCLLQDNVLHGCQLPQHIIRHRARQPASGQV